MHHVPILTPCSRGFSARKRKRGAGKLRIFFGATAGVGKTYAMLEEARAAKAKGVDVVVGYVEPHGRAETEALLEGLEQLPFLDISYRGVTLREFDLDAALARKPALLLVDELAHTNPTEGEPRPRHAKRWQDVEELLAAGIDVYTTVNVQHIESLNDVVARHHRRAYGGNGARPRVRVGRRSRTDRPAARRIARPVAGRQGLHSRSRRGTRSRTSSARAT